MASDISRKTFDAQKHYSGVLMQQGRVLLDADWNEQLDIEQYRLHTETVDVIGQSGVPKNLPNSFKISVLPTATDVQIAAGRIYLGGLLCELGAAASYLHQPYYPNPADTQYFPANAASKLTIGTYITYLEAWQRDINHWDDPELLEVALGGADTTTRLQTVWQVKLLKVTNGNGHCKTTYSEWDTLIAPPTGMLNVQTQAVTSPDLCQLPPSAGYLSLENQLYRIEVQKGGTLGTATFKWSRDNATVESAIEKIAGNVLTVVEIGKDEVLNFAVGQWVEIVTEASTLKRTPQYLRKITAVNVAKREITVDGAAPNQTEKAKLRRWDQDIAVGTIDGIATPNPSAWLDIEDGIQVQFSSGTYQAGDYWLIPARTATGAIEWDSNPVTHLPIPQSPHGTKHQYCRLALLKVTATGVIVEDCRRLFSPLTELEPCEDLRMHNKHLHGYGVVCGLKMVCGPNRTAVVIEKGYALDCEGNSIMLKTPHRLPFNVVEVNNQNLAAAALLKDGIFTVSIANGGDKNPVFTIEPYQSQTFWDRVLEGTLLKDFYEECIKTLIDFFKDQFSFSLNEVVPVSEKQRRLTAFVNLLLQLVNPASGPYGFISGNTGSTQLDEDQLLRNFYQDLKQKLASETFCAMYDGDDPFPQYVLDEGLKTVFGPPLKAHNRLRLHLNKANKQFAYTCGYNNQIYVYDIEKNELIQTTAFPGIVATGSIQDIAVSSLHSELYAVSVVGNDSFIVAATIKSSGVLSWKTPSLVKDMKLVSLGLGQEDQVYAIARGKGLYQFKNIRTNDFSVTTWQTFNATGLLNMSQDPTTQAWRALAAEFKGSQIESTVFSGVRIIGISQQTHTVSIPVDESTDALNDIAVYQNRAYITSGAKGKRILGEYAIGDGQARQLRVASLDNDSAIRLAVYAGNKIKTPYVLLTLSDKLKVVRVSLSDNSKEFQVDPKFRIPVQLFPMAIVMDSTGQNGYVLNMLVNTVTAMNLARVFHESPRPDFTQEPPYNLHLYRDGVIEAYRDVLNHLLQSLKDCFCDKFLIDCPDCGEEDKVYLGCVEVREGKIYHICNFSKRKYVKTFRTVDYWLSTVPIMPIMREVLGKFCCSILDISLIPGLTKKG